MGGIDYKGAQEIWGDWGGRNVYLDHDNDQTIIWDCHSSSNYILKRANHTACKLY